MRQKWEFTVISPLDLPLDQRWSPALPLEEHSMHMFFVPLLAEGQDGECRAGGAAAWLCLLGLPKRTLYSGRKV